MAQAEGPLLPYARIVDFLSQDEHRQLLDWAVSSRDRFRPATVSKGRPKREFRVDPERRIGLTTRKLGPLEAVLRERLLAALPELMTGTGTGGPPPTSLELELAAHGDGAYYRPHIEHPGRRQPPAAGRQSGRGPGVERGLLFLRRAQGVHRRPVAAVRIRPDPAAGEQQRAHIDLEPVRNSLVAFSSWVPHEVRPIAVPGGDFGAYRFALNC